MDTDEYTSIVFTITRGSFVDGWGIRTTIFLKGCPLRCIWCCNPKANPFAGVVCYAGRVHPCGLCRDVCEYLELESDGPTVDRRLCTNAECAELCPTKRWRCSVKFTPLTGLFELIRDKEYYDRSGGG